MKTLRVLLSGFAALAFAAILTTPASARCGANLQAGSTGAGLFSLRPRTSPFPAMAARMADPAPRAATSQSIMGFWYTQARLDGQLMDDGFDMLQSDGMEILNDSPAPASGAICMGVYSQTAPNTYTVFHPAWAFDPTNTTVIGVVVIQETVTLSADGNRFSGKGTTDVYDFEGNSLFHVAVDVSGVRIAPNDLPQAGGIPGLPLSILNR
jgi:hypothetical protein